MNVKTITLLTISILSLNTYSISAATLTKKEILAMVDAYNLSANEVTRTVVQPPVPDLILNSRSLNGIDSNHNHVCDIAERVIWQSFANIPDATMLDYEQTLNVSKMFWIGEDQNYQNIENIKMAYAKLSPRVKIELSFDMLQISNNVRYGRSIIGKNAYKRERTEQ